jgi:hypothetical protein
VNHVKSLETLEGRVGERLK